MDIRRKITQIFRQSKTKDFESLIVLCPKNSCEDYGMTGKGNISGNGTYQTKKMVLFINLFAKHALKVSLQIQTQYCMIEADEKAVFFGFENDLERYGFTLYSGSFGC